VGNWHNTRAALSVRRGGIIAYPTEAVYGLGCNPWDDDVVFRLLSLKRRAPDKGLIVIAAEIAQLAGLVDFSGKFDLVAVAASWPGPVTWILPARAGVPYWLTGRHRGIAVRVSDHPVVRALCLKTGPLIATSANPAGAPPARTSARVRCYFGDNLDYILPGRVGELSGPTEIRNAVTGARIRIAG
jgi:L-threonylcarbamoyladenylate synthase